MDFLDRITKLRSGNIPFTLEIDDPAGNCFIYNPNAPNPDPKLIIEDYERTKEQIEELGLDFMDTDPDSYMVRERTFIMVKPDGT